MNFTFGHMNFNVKDLEASIAFYQEALNLHVLRRSEAKDGRYSIAFMGDAVGTAFSLELTYLRDHPQAYDLGEEEYHLAFTIADYDAAYQKHKEMGCICFENKDMGLYFIQDPDGYWLEIVPLRR